LFLDNAHKNESDLLPFFLFFASYPEGRKRKAIFHTKLFFILIFKNDVKHQNPNFLADKRSIRQLNLHPF